jgi:hypothetical protein
MGAGLCFFWITSSSIVLADQPAKEASVSQNPEDVSSLTIGTQSALVEGPALTLHPEPLRRQTLTALPADAPASSGALSWGQRFSNDEQNSRLATHLPPGTWSVRWQQHLNTNSGGQPFANLLQSGDRLLVFAGGQEIHLLDLQGRLISNAGAVSWNPILLGDEGYILSEIGDDYRLSDMTKAWSTSLEAPAGMAKRRWMSLKKQMITVAWSIFDYDHHTGRKSSSAVIMSIEAKPGFTLWKPYQDYLDLVASLRWNLPSYALVLVGQGDQLVMAIPGALIRANRRLELQKAWLLPPGIDYPLSLALDEAGRTYYLSRTDDQHVRLTVIEPTGAIVMEKDIPATYADGFPATSAEPPMVSFDHRVVLRLDRRWVCIDLKGNILWERPYTSQPPTDGLVTADNRILFAEGTQVLARSMDGRETVLYDFAPEKIMAQPILTPAGNIVVATESSLASLEP